MSVNLDDLRNARNDLLHHVNSGRFVIPAEVREQLDRAVIAIFEQAEQERLYPSDKRHRPSRPDSITRGAGRASGVAATCATKGTTVTRHDYLEATS